MHRKTTVGCTVRSWLKTVSIVIHCNNLQCNAVQWATVTMVMRVRQGVMCSDRILRHWRNLISHSAHPVSLECGGELWGGEICDEIEISKCLWPTYLLNQSQQASLVPAHHRHHPWHQSGIRHYLKINFHTICKKLEPRLVESSNGLLGTLLIACSLACSNKNGL